MKLFEADATAIMVPHVKTAEEVRHIVEMKHGKFVMAPGLMAPRPILAAEGYRVFTLGADVLGLGEYFKAKLAGFEQ